MMRKVTLRDIKEYVSRKGKPASQETSGKCTEIATNDIENDEQEETLSALGLTLPSHGHEKWAKGAATARKASLKSSRCGILSSIRRKMSRSDAISSSDSDDCYSFVPSSHKTYDKTYDKTRTNHVNSKSSSESAPLDDKSSLAGCHSYGHRASADAIDGAFIQVYQDTEVVVNGQDASWHCQSSCSEEEVPEIPARPLETLRDSYSDPRESSMYAMVRPAVENSPCRSFPSLTTELQLLSKHGWYWGPISRREAEEKLSDQSDGAFLVRDSSDDRYLLSLSFRSYGKTLHTRIERNNGLFSFYMQPEHDGHESIVELIRNSMACSQTAVFCYSRARVPGAPTFPVRLMKPVSRFTQVRSLQYLCRFVIRQNTRLDHIQKLPLPNRIKGYIEEGHY